MGIRKPTSARSDTGKVQVALAIEMQVTLSVTASLAQASVSLTKANEAAMYSRIHANTRRVQYCIL